MKDNEIRTLLRDSTQETRLRPAEEFWAEFRARAGIWDDAHAVSPKEAVASRVNRKPARHPASFFTRRRVVAAAAAAVFGAAVLLTSLLAESEPAPVFNDVEFGPEFKHNGVVVITDEPTQAKILWVLTEGV